MPFGVTLNGDSDHRATLMGASVTAMNGSNPSAAAAASTADLVVIGSTLQLQGSVDGNLVLIGGSGSCASVDRAVQVRTALASAAAAALQ